MTAPATAEEIRDVNTRYHDVAARRLRRQVGHRLRRDRPGRRCWASCARRSGGDPGPFGARARDRRRHRLLLAEPGARGRRSRDATCTDISPGMLATLQRQRRAARRRGRRPGRATPRPAVRGRRASTSCSATRCCTTCPTSTARSPSSAACCKPGRQRRRSPASRPATATASRATPSAPPPPGARVARAAARAPGRRGPQRRRRRRTTSSRARSTSTRSRPATSRATRGGRASRTCASAARSCWPTGSAGRTARSRPPRTRRRSLAWRQYAYRGYIALQHVDRALLEPRLPPAIFYNLMIAGRSPRDSAR